jgi:hypothetical protein
MRDKQGHRRSRFAGKDQVFQGKTNYIRTVYGTEPHYI